MRQLSFVFLFFVFFGGTVKQRDFTSCKQQKKVLFLSGMELIKAFSQVSRLNWTTPHSVKLEFIISMLWEMAESEQTRVFHSWWSELFFSSSTVMFSHEDVDVMSWHFPLDTYCSTFNTSTSTRVIYCKDTLTSSFFFIVVFLFFLMDSRIVKCH